MSSSLHRLVSAALQELDAGGNGATEILGEQPDQRIGHYTLLECLGQGGFGAVWRAAQSEPVRREVALKIIKLGMDTREVTTRFELERQALAVMDHPGIAKVFDAGATPSGRPYFVMELIRGTRLTRYCDEAALPLRERLELFIEVCRAVQHAHQKGVIHRDLKPSNLLVTAAGGKPMPKVIDFGIAKATSGERLTDQTLVTRLDRLMGTPAYMSPEQSEPGRDIDTRTDIYSLGVVLYELIAGSAPKGKNGGQQRDKEVKRPSAFLRSLTGEHLSELAGARATEGPRLISQVKGDLDWIVIKALEHERERRFESADALAADLQAFLEQRPVAARPPTAWYLARRFAQRHKAATAATLAVVLALVAGIATSTTMYLRAQREIERSRQVTRFLRETLAQAGPSNALGRDATMMREILDKTAARLDTELRDRPEVEAELRGIIGQTYTDLGEHRLAFAQSTAALRLRRAMSSHDSEELADAIFNQGAALEYLGRSNESEKFVREALAMRRRLYGDADPRTLQVHAELAWVLMKGRRSWEEAEASARLATEAWRKAPTDLRLINAPKALAAILHNTNRHEESRRIFQEELDTLRRTYGLEHPDVAVCLDNLGVQLCRMNRFDEAEPLLLEALRQEKIFFGDHMPHANHILTGLTRVAASRKDWDLQLHYAREGLEAARKVYLVDHRIHRDASNVLAKVLMEHAERELTTAPQWALALLDELAGSKDFQTTVQLSAGWLDCLRAAALGAEADRREEARTLLARGIEALRSKEKPNSEDRRRLKQAETFLAEW